MIARIFILSALLLLAFGCTEQAPPKEPDPVMTCDEYCKQQPHAQCVGNWNISGEYPVCICQFVCNEVEPDEPEEEIPNPAAENCQNKGYDYELRENTGYCSYEGSECEEWELFRMECCLTDSDCSQMDCGHGSAFCNSSTCACPEPEESEVDSESPELPEPTDKSVEELVDGMISEADSLFYSGIEGGDFTQKTYKWILQDKAEDPTTVPVGNRGVEGDVLFDNQEMEGIIGFGAKTYVQSDGVEEEAYAIAVLDSDSVFLRDFESGSDWMDILYRPPAPDVVMENCDVTKRNLLSQENYGERLLYVYRFKCTDVEIVGE